MCKQNVEAEYKDTPIINLDKILIEMWFLFMPLAGMLQINNMVNI